MALGQGELEKAGAAAGHGVLGVVGHAVVPQTRWGSNMKQGGEEGGAAVPGSSGGADGAAAAGVEAQRSRSSSRQVRISAEGVVVIGVATGPREAV